MNTPTSEKLIDVVVIGGGPAGLMASVYIARAMLSCLIIESNMPGGKMMETYEIENYGSYSSIKGVDLSMKMQDHAEHFGAKFCYDQVVNITNLNDKVKEVKLKNGVTIPTKAVVIASGTTFRKLNVPGEQKYYSFGVSTCAVCDGALYKGKIVVVIGAGNSATEEALYLTRFVKKVYLIHRTEKFRATIPNIEKVSRHKQIELILNTIVLEIKGDGSHANAVVIKNVISAEVRTLAISCVFPYIGQLPNTQFLQATSDGQRLLADDFVKIINDKFATTSPGVFAAGDIVEKTLRQVANAVGDGANAGQAAVSFVDNWVNS